MLDSGDHISILAICELYLDSGIFFLTSSILTVSLSDSNDCIIFCNSFLVIIILGIGPYLVDWMYPLPHTLFMLISLFLSIIGYMQD